MKHYTKSVPPITEGLALAEARVRGAERRLSDLLTGLASDQLFAIQQFVRLKAEADAAAVGYTLAIESEQMSDEWVQHERRLLPEPVSIASRD